MSKAKWYFPNNGGGLAAGFNDSSIDTFKGHRLSSLVREIVQNSLDACFMRTEPVTVAFNIVSIDKATAPEVAQLKEHLLLAKETAKKQDPQSKHKKRNLWSGIDEPSRGSEGGAGRSS